MRSHLKTIIFVAVVALLVYGFFAFDIPYRKAPDDFGSRAVAPEATTSDASLTASSTATTTPGAVSTTSTTTLINKTR